MIDRRYLGLFLLALSSTSFAAPIPDPFAAAAEYYYLRYDYRRAYDLWRGVYDRLPGNLHAALRVAELKLMFEGRVAARDQIVNFARSQAKVLGQDEKKQLRERLGRIQATFLTDDGQAIFFQALPRLKRKDCASAVSLLAQSAVLEKGNLRVLREKARCEKSLGTYEAFYETLKAANGFDPFDGEIVDNLAETHLYFRQPKAVTALVSADGEFPRNARQRRALAFALWEAGHGAAALPLLQQLLEQDRLGGAHPIVLFALGNIFAARPGSRGEAMQYLERFIATVKRPANALVDGWDPYRCTERAEAAQKTLLSLKSES